MCDHSPILELRAIPRAVGGAGASKLLAAKAASKLLVNL